MDSTQHRAAAAAFGPDSTCRGFDRCRPARPLPFRRLFPTTTSYPSTSRPRPKKWDFANRSTSATQLHEHPCPPLSALRLRNIAPRQRRAGGFLLCLLPVMDAPLVLSAIRFLSKVIAFGVLGVMSFVAGRLVQRARIREFVQLLQRTRTDGES